MWNGMNQSRRNKVSWRKQVSSINGLCLKMGQISRSLESRSPRNQRVLFHLTSFLNLIFIITLSAIKMWLYYSLYRPQSIHKIVPNRINWFVLMMGLALETSAFSSLYSQELPRGDPRGSCSPPPPPPQFPFGSSALSSSGIWNLESIDWRKDLSQSILGIIALRGYPL